MSPRTLGMNSTETLDVIHMLTHYVSLQATHVVNVITCTKLWRTDRSDPDTPLH